MVSQIVTLASHPGEEGTQFQLWSVDMLTMIQSTIADEPVFNCGLYSGVFTDIPDDRYRLIHVDQYGEAMWESCVVLKLINAIFLAHDAAFAVMIPENLRDAIGMSAPNLEDKLATIQTMVADIDVPLDSEIADSVVSALAAGTQVFGHSYLESIKRIEMASGAATLSGAGTGTEVMTSSDGLKTATFTVDDDGNVSAVVWT